MNRRSQAEILGFWMWIGFVAPGVAAPADPKVLHLLNRLSLGPRPGDVQKVEAIGVETYIQQQLAPEKIPEPKALSDRLSQLATLKLSPLELGQQLRQLQQNRKQTRVQQSQPAQPVQPQPAQQPLRLVLQQATEARFLRATQSDRQLQEVMVDFWYNHFNVFAGKGLDRVLVGSYEETAIRPHTLGRFRDLLGATSQGQLARNLTQLGKGLAALQTGLGAIYAHTTIVILSEFGRTVKENGNGGTDHGHGNVMTLLGGGIKGGKIYADWRGLGTDQLNQGRDLPVTTDFRAVLSPVLQRHLGLDSAKLTRVFPGYKLDRAISIV